MRHRYDNVWEQEFRRFVRFAVPVIFIGWGGFAVCLFLLLTR